MVKWQNITAVTHLSCFITVFFHLKQIFVHRDFPGTGMDDTGKLQVISTPFNDNTVSHSSYDYTFATDMTESSFLWLNNEEQEINFPPDLFSLVFFEKFCRMSDNQWKVKVEWGWHILQSILMSHQWKRRNALFCWITPEKSKQFDGLQERKYLKRMWVNPGKQEDRPRKKSLNDVHNKRQRMSHALTAQTLFTPHLFFLFFILSLRFLRHPLLFVGISCCPSFLFLAIIFRL